MTCKEFGKKFGKQFTAIKFYQRIMGFLLQVEDIHTVERTILDVFTLLQSKYIDNNEAKEIHDYLYQQSRTHKIDKNYKTEKLEEELQSSTDSTFRETKSKFHRWVCSLAAQARLKVQKYDETTNECSNIYDTSSDESFGAKTSKTVNAFYCPGFESTLIDFFRKLPLAGCMMNKYFKAIDLVPTSSSTECNFRVLKQNVFNRVAGKRVDCWLETHIDFADGRIDEKDLEDEDGEAGLFENKDALKNV